MDTIRIFDAGKYKQFYVEILMDILGLFSDNREKVAKKIGKLSIDFESLPKRIVSYLQGIIGLFPHPNLSR